MNIRELRQIYHQRLCNDVIRIREKGNYPNFADASSEPSKLFAWGIVRRIGCGENFHEIQGQTVGRSFEIITKEFLESAFSLLHHLRPGKWEYSAANTDISNFVQYEHLAYIEEALRNDHTLHAALGGNYVVRPDIVVSRWPAVDEEIDKQGILTGETEGIAQLTPLRQKNHQHIRQILHGVISCKWTIRTDRAQNTRTEVLNLIRNRKGHLPHIVAVTAEPWPARIAALALGTGDLDCVYHFALPELQTTVQAAGNDDSMELLKIMIEGRRLRDISDLPFDLAI